MANADLSMPEAHLRNGRAEMERLRRGAAFYALASFNGLLFAGVCIRWVLTGTNDPGMLMFASTLPLFLFSLLPGRLLPWQRGGLRAKEDGRSSFITTVSWDHQFGSSITGVLWVKDGFLVFESSREIEFVLPASIHHYTLDRGLGNIALPRLEVVADGRSATATFEVVDLFKPGGRERSETLFRMLERWSISRSPSTPQLLPSFLRQEEAIPMQPSLIALVGVGILVCASSALFPSYLVLLFSTAFCLVMGGAALHCMLKANQVRQMVEHPYAALRIAGNEN